MGFNLFLPPIRLANLKPNFKLHTRNFSIDSSQTYRCYIFFNNTIISITVLIFNLYYIFYKFAYLLIHFFTINFPFLMTLKILIFIGVKF
jgi:hypothetical protein